MKNKVVYINPDEMKAGLEMLLNERYRYREALERLRDCDWVITLPDRMDAVRQIAKEALSA